MSQHRIASFEFGRIVAIIAIITLHCQLFMQYPLFNGQPLLGMGINQASRFAVPLFFIMAGYFIQPRLTSSQGSSFLSYARPLLIMWVSWSMIYLILPLNFNILSTQGYLAERTLFWNKLLQTPLNTLFEGGLVHLWYIPGLLCGLGVIALLIKLKLQRFMVIIAAILFTYGLAAGSYSIITDMSAPIFTRNGPFFSTLMLTIGFEIRRRHITLKLWQGVAMMFIGFILFISEANYLSNLTDGSFYHDFLLGTPLWSAGIFFILLALPTLGDSAITHKWSKDILGIYLCHLLIVIYYLNLVHLLKINPIIANICAVPVVFFVSMLIVRLLRKIPFTRFLVR